MLVLTFNLSHTSHIPHFTSYQDVNLNDEASEYGRSLFNLGEGDMLLFSEEMIDMSLEKGSRDNISACAMKLQVCNVM